MLEDAKHDEPEPACWDIDSAPDVERFAIANNLVGRPDTEIQEKVGDKFPKHIFHSIICTAFCYPTVNPRIERVDAIGAPHVGEGRKERSSRHSLTPSQS